MQQRNNTKSSPAPNLPFGRRGGPHSIGLAERAENTADTLRRLWGYLRRQRRELTTVIVLVTITTGVALLGPYLMGVAIDDYIESSDRHGLAVIALLMLAVYGVQSLTTWLHTLLMIRVSAQTVRDLRSDLFTKVQALSLRFFDRRPHGELMSNMTNDVENVNMVLTENVTNFIQSVLTLVGVVVMMLAINVWLAMVSLIVLPLTAYMTRYVARHTRVGFRDQQAALGTLNGLIEETITGGRVVRAFGRENTVIDEFDEMNRRLRDASIHAQTFAGLMGPGGNLIYNIGFVVIAAAGGWMAVEDIATIGTIASFMTYTQQLRGPMNQVANMFNTIQSALAGAERVFAILDETPELDDAPDAIPLNNVKGTVEFDSVSFGYAAELPVLKHVSLRADIGQTVALVGPTGAGKTTIINLLSRFYDIDSGSIRIDGHDIRGVKKHDLRRQLGIVLQDTFLFSETVFENIRYGRLDASDDDVIAAAKMANADHFIRRLPHGYETLLSERAENLSQGQRQLLAIARAILADPAILILDEATSSVDTRTEILVQEAMRRLMTGRTSFVIAHRLSTIREADQILVINHGEVIERGTHHELLDQRGFYYNLYMSQFKQTGQLPAAS